MTYRVAHLTFKGGHAAQDWPKIEQAEDEVCRLQARDDVVCILLVDGDCGQMILRRDFDKPHHWRQGAEETT